MRNKASGFLKQIGGVLAGLTKAKSLALKGKTNALKVRVLLLSLLPNRRLLVQSISHKLHNLLGPRGRDDDDDDDGGGGEEQAERSKAIVLYARGRVGRLAGGEESEEEKKYPELTHSLFELEDFEDPGGSVIDLVKSSKQEGEDFVLEDEIDRVADLFIMRFHRQIRMQKQLSLKRFNEALDRSQQ